LLAIYIKKGQRRSICGGVMTRAANEIIGTFSLFPTEATSAASSHLLLPIITSTFFSLMSSSAAVKVGD